MTGCFSGVSAPVVQARAQVQVQIQVQMQVQVQVTVQLQLQVQVEGRRGWRALCHIGMQGAGGGCVRLHLADCSPYF